MIELYDYQKKGCEFLSSRSRAYLADVMGIGKSAQAIRAFEKVEAKTIIIVCPAIVRFNWRNEIEKFATTERKVNLLFSKNDSPEKDAINIGSYEIICTDILRKKIQKIQPDVVIADEAHYLKNRKAKRSKYFFGHRMDEKGGIIENVPYVWLLSGTPMPNNPSELYPWMKAFNIGDSNYYSFVDKYCDGYNGDYGFKITGVKNKELLKAKLEPILLRRTKEEVMPEMEPITISQLYVDAFEPEEDRQERLTQEILFEQEIMNSIVSGVPMKRNPHIATLRRMTAMAKIQAVYRVIKNEMADGAYDRIVVFGIHKMPLGRLRDSFPSPRPILIYGGTPAHKKENLVNKFILTNNGRKQSKVLIANMKAAGIGLNLTCANQIIFLESDWTPCNNQQAIMRCHRIGQTKPVTVRFATLRNSLDQRVQEIIAEKTKMVGEIFN